MCGIVGFKLTRPVTPADIARGLDGLPQLSHRGPDGQRHWADHRAGLWLGHTRLAIIDLSDASAQPMTRTPATLAYNGELYNFRELRASLADLGMPCDTAGDTEVVLRAWQAWGPAALERFDGMFAFALFDGQTLHLVTDAFGEKPLYWAQQPDGVYFASEPAVLTAWLDATAAPTAEELSAFLALGFLPGGATGYPGVKRLPPASHLTVTPEGQVSLRRWWSPPPPAIAHGPVKPLTERQLDGIHRVLLESVRRRVYSDAPLGIFLSSGTDSAIVAAMVARDLKIGLQALTVSFPDGRDEGRDAEAIAAALRLPHQTLDSRQHDADPSVQQVVALYGELNDNLTVLPAHHMGQAARPLVKSALTGMGGDELFYGYGRYQLLHRWRAFFALPEWMRRGLAAAAETCGPRRGALRAISQLGGIRSSCRLAAVRNYPACRWVDALPALEDTMRRLGASAPRWPSAVGARYVDIEHTLPGSYIPAIERGCMRASVEVRTPFLSRELFAAVAACDQRALYAFGQKQVLKRLLRRYLPADLVERPKRGFVFPAARFLPRLPAEAPRLPGLDSTLLHEAWTRRRQPGFQQIAIRIALASAFLSERAAPSRDHVGLRRD